ncbi:type I secretion system protein LssZ [Legionella bononiensis]|uniref:Type I secretion system protein LssZ n=1 Tax=Legionella bononiensis TaxID=2793102 RepID=A0ABS1WFA8_9GAMM|nr:type I secretion system protein LssZ [Legionella bononiensis]MBL7479230.1 type I secretion system protein LssZ [Legionella bononiensis]MBL7528043.1 type I secretion system protein LssZ [Legionella bononiensis]MBL7563880.1 type I secretion system protein LssZ [Legionella bononiensis]
MYNLAKVIHSLFPLMALVLLIIGIKRKAIYYVISALWLSLIALVIHFQSSGGEILGTYFNYVNAAIYSANLIILFVSLVKVIDHLSSDSSLFRYVSTLIQSVIVIGSLLLITNLWINAYFIENRMTGTPVMQVALLQKPEYCSYRYIFYKVAADGSVLYLCPNHYGLVPSIGRLEISPDFITTQLSVPSKKQMLLLQKKRVETN